MEVVVMGLQSMGWKRDIDVSYGVRDDAKFTSGRHIIPRGRYPLE
jgi:hypothetical protein